MLFADELYEKLDKNIYPNSIYHWIPKNCINVLKTQNRNNLKQYYPDIEKLSYYDEAEDKIVKWYETNCYINILIEQRLINGYDVLEIGYETLGAGWILSFAVEEKNCIDGVWYLSCIEAKYTKSTKNTNCFTRWPVENDECKILLKFDGDYLDIYINDLDHYYDTFCRIDTDTFIEYKYLIENNECDFNTVTWPCHADGTCDYDGSSKKVTTANTSQPKTSEATKTGSNTNVAPNKTMSTNCNLKLRSGEATSTQVLTVMSVGTKVKILELGKAETIDGINSNWVKVEVQSGAKDRDGKAIKADTVGWCYGGYLE